MGYRLTGSDLKLSATTAALAQRGVTVYEGQQAAHLNNASLVVTTAAAGEDNPELLEARRLGLIVLQNAEMAGAILNRQRLLAVAGTHGKTTTTGLAAFLLDRAGLDPTFYIGGVSTDLATAGRAGGGQYAVVEADEYARRFLHYRPEAAVVTNIEADHLDYYGTFEALKAAFVQFASNLRSEGRLYACADDLQAVKLARQVRSDVQSSLYGLSEQAAWRVVDPYPNELGGYTFQLQRRGEFTGEVRLALPGLHNVLNACGALAMVIEAVPQIDPQRFCELAAAYHGTARRFELKGEACGVTVVDDYAHHPTEIKATLAAARARYGPRRLVALFQPHTYSRTRALLDEFASAFEIADIVALMDIFAAREQATLGVSTADIITRMQHSGVLGRPLLHRDAAAGLLEILQPGDVLLTLGAGDVWKVGEQVLADLTASSVQPV